MNKRKVNLLDDLADLTSSGRGFSVRRFGARAHQIALSDRNARWIGDRGNGGTSGPCKILVQNGKPKTKEGAALIAGNVAAPSKFLRGF